MYIYIFLLLISLKKKMLCIGRFDPGISSTVITRAIPIGHHVLSITFFKCIIINYR